MKMQEWYIFRSADGRKLSLCFYVIYLILRDEQNLWRGFKIIDKGGAQ
jgi:hypothetical protein